ncbi:MAG: OmpA family protein [Bacteroidota bacterium]
MKYSKYILFIVFCFGFQIAMSQSLRKADTEFENKNYMVAAKMYEQLFPKIKEKDDILETAYKIGECYRLINRYDKANTWYKKAVDRRYKDNDIQFKYALTLMMAEEYKLADKMLKQYMNTRPSEELKEMARLKMKSCSFALESTDSARFTARNLQEINTRANDFAPTTVKEKIVFTSSRYTRDSTTYKITGDGFENLYETRFDRETELFTKVDLLQGAINSDINNGTLVFDPKRNIGYFMQCNGLSGKDKNCNIYVSEFKEQDNIWTRPEIFQHNSKEYSSGHPALSPDGNTLYFVSNNPEGMGGTDIWVTSRSDDDESWSRPENLGEPINTFLDEMFPYMFDNTGLYFSSNGHIGYGGLDLYFAERNDSVFNEPENMQKPFNSSADDFGIVFINGRSGLFSSNKKGGVGQDDLYYFAARGVHISAAGRVTNSETEKPVENALVILTDHTGFSDTVTTDEDGNYQFNLLKQEMGYYMVSVKDDYLNPQKRSFSTNGINQDIILSAATGYDLDFALTRIEEGKEYNIKNIYYDLDKYFLRPESIKELDNIVNILNNNPEICIQINSHTDVRAPDDYNVVLSNNRAKSVVDYLVSQKIDTARLSWQGWGETKLAIPNAQTEEEHQANRRTTFTIVNYDQLHLGEKAEFHKQTVERLEKQQAQKRGVEEPTINGVYFRLQIAAAHKPCNSKIFAKIKDAFPDTETYCSQSPDGFYKYTVGYYLFLDQAEAMKSKIDALGYNSFIVAYKNGKRISINEALKEIKN